MKSIKALVPVAGLIVLGGCSETAQTVVEENWLGDASIGTINGNDVPESLFRRLALDTIQKPAEDMSRRCVS